MRSITIHDLDPSIAALVKQRARDEGLSLNRTLKLLLEEALGVRPAAQKHRAHFEKFCGMWTKAQAAEFDRTVADLGTVDPADWR